jgi:metal-responsive CopG/Arc/MetJ family transcriptional regulator
MKKQIRWNLFLPPELLDEVRVLAGRKGVAASDVVRTAVSKYLAAVRKAEETRNAAQ